jgi:hypothetical protein
MSAFPASEFFLSKLGRATTFTTLINLPVSQKSHQDLGLEEVKPFVVVYT